MPNAIRHGQGAGVSQVPSQKPDYPPLLTDGLHTVDVRELRRMCVDEFSKSSTRDRIMRGLEEVISRLERESVRAEAWVDGSFVTQKTDPEDVDVVFRIPAHLYDQGSPRQQRAIDWVAEVDRRDTHKCDAYAILEYPTTDPLHYLSRDHCQYWKRIFGCSRAGAAKGIAVVPVLGGIE